MRLAIFGVMDEERAYSVASIRLFNDIATLMGHEETETVADGDSCVFVLHTFF